MTAFRCALAMVSRTMRITASVLAFSVVGEAVSGGRAAGAQAVNTARTQTTVRRRRATGMPDLGRGTPVVRKLTHKWAFQGVSVIAEWFLTSGERGNPNWDLPPWSEGNEAEALIHGASYFDRL